MLSGSSTQNRIFINAPQETLYRAFTDPDALEVWLVPGEMTGTVHSFDYRVGGGYEMSVYYSALDSEKMDSGKTRGREDRYRARFTELAPPDRIVEAITFDTDDPAFSGEMTMEVTLTAENGGTTVTIAFKDIPQGIKPEDNEAGTQSSLEKLARYIEQGTDGKET